jgi:hypothetical protein
MIPQYQHATIEFVRWRAHRATTVTHTVAGAGSPELINHRPLAAQGIPRAPLPLWPLSIITGGIRQIAAELLARVNPGHAGRFRGRALQVLDLLRGGALVP